MLVVIVEAKKGAQETPYVHFFEYQVTKLTRVVSKTFILNCSIQITYADFFDIFIC